MFGLVEGRADSVARATDEAEQAIGIDGHSSTVLGFAGCALCDVGELRRGIDILEQAIASDASNAQARVALGTALIRAGKARTGIEHLRHGMRISPLDNRASYWGTNLAYALFRLGDSGRQRQKPASPAAVTIGSTWHGSCLALILARQGHLTDARAAIREALRLRPDLCAEDMRGLVGRRGVEILRTTGLLS